MRTDVKPPLGVKPGVFCAWQRIGDLVEAIQRHYESADGNAHMCEQWAKEIQMQCQIIQNYQRAESSSPKV